LGFLPLNMQLYSKDISKPCYEQLIQLTERFTVATVLNSNHYEDKYGKYEWIAACGADEFIAPSNSSFAALEKFQHENRWVFGGFSYDLKNELEKLNSRTDNPIGFPMLYFFAPQFLFLQRRNVQKVELFIANGVSNEVIESVLELLYEEVQINESQVPLLQPRISERDYLEKIGALKKHIQRGDIYEVNFCQEFYARNSVINPAAVMIALNSSAPMPFSTFFKCNASYLMGATPERFLCKRGETLIAQPIKGTLKRANHLEREVEQLKNDPKEQNENVMIVDLMRNDLSKVAQRGSVQVEELFGVYSFPKVHQMISTISAKLKPEISSVEAIKQAFPMGSMTGAPKVSAMKLIDNHEESRRGWYSGAVGYFDADGDFDFNVIIRSLQYNAENQYCSLIVGGAITDQSIPEKEYAECLLKAKSVFNLTTKK
jgi:para-aminobenzoate synthetase component I